MDDMSTRVNREKLTLSGRPRAPPSPKPFAGAFVPSDDFDRVSKMIWSRATEAMEEVDRGQSSPERRWNKDCKAADNKPSHRAEEQRKEAGDFGLSARLEEDKQQRRVAFTRHRRPHVAKPGRALSPMMEKGAEDQQRSVENSPKKIGVSKSSSRRDKHPVQGKAKAPQAKSKRGAPPAAPMQQKAFALLADFPVLRSPENPVALGALFGGNPKTEGAERNRGIANSQNQCQESGASHRRRMENMPHEVSSICAGDHESVLDLQTFGSTGISLNQRHHRVAAGTDGVDVNARTRVSAAKAGMKRAAAPQEKARPCTFQPIVIINRAIVRYSATSGPRPRHQTLFVRPAYAPRQPHFGAQLYRANCPQDSDIPVSPSNRAGVPRLNTATCDDSRRDAK